MTQYVNVIGVGPVGFPDDMTMEQITEVLRTMPPPAAAPAMPPDTLGRQVGLATRPMAQTVLTAGGMLPMVVDPMVNLFNLAAGTSIPTQTQAVEKTYKYAHRHPLLHGTLHQPQPPPQGWAPPQRLTQTTTPATQTGGHCLCRHRPHRQAVRATLLGW